MCEASHVKFAPVFHQIVQVHMYENVTYGPSQYFHLACLGDDRLLRKNSDMELHPKYIKWGVIPNLFAKAFLVIRI